MSGQNKRINNQIKEINESIEKDKLNLIPLIRYLDDEGNKIDDGRLEKYDEVNNAISETIGELRGLTMPTAPRTPKKKEEYKRKIQDLENKKSILEERKKQQS